MKKEGNTNSEKFEHSDAVKRAIATNERIDKKLREWNKPTPEEAAENLKEFGKNTLLVIFIFIILLLIFLV